MKDNYDFTEGRRGAVVPASRKTRISIRLDPKVLEWFKSQAEKNGGGNYQTLMNQVLLGHVNSEGEPLERILRKVIREELHHDIHRRTPGGHHDTAHHR